MTKGREENISLRPLVYSSCHTSEIGKQHWVAVYDELSTTDGCGVVQESGTQRWYKDHC